MGREGPPPKRRAHLGSSCAATASRSAFAETGGHLYGGLFDTICAALETWVPVNRYVLRHAINATFGWVGVVYCGRLAARLFGPWAGRAGDGPAGGLAAVLRRLDEQPEGPAVRGDDRGGALLHLDGLADVAVHLALDRDQDRVSLALALNVRVGALLYLGYFGLLIAALRRLPSAATNWRRLADTAAGVAAVVGRDAAARHGVLALGRRRRR